MTTPSPNRGAVSVEPMTDRFDRLRDRDREAQALRHTWINVRVEDLTALLVHALPLARRYTGGPLEDGLYLWRPAFWGAGLRDWASIDTSTLTGRYDFKEIVDAEAEVWLIGPISIPPIPESEGASS